ncbi:GntR family transcriptional regulator [Haloactinopolyspora alba]|uniref:GntR family transcriptional regulator n=1 Tax=Haloactinopolyspora alba TaxID=648780 RepID=A0A2P8DVN8_9ACTN|nr:GntR family transcriptional regulator [Haloactinopolyspora alba]PSL01276.1 GntR family transcriptional regulator [Haloactinopolyspora alba]
MSGVKLNRLRRVSLRERVLTELQGHIVSGTFAPGQRLNDSELAEQLGVSRTPVREALQQLQAMGLVEAIPGASTRVTEVDAADAAAVFPVVAQLHALATRLAVDALTAADVERLHRHNADLLEATKSGDRDRMMDADTAFHDVFIELSGNPVLAELLDQLTPRVRRFEYALFDDAAGHASAHDHEQIIAACEASDVGRIGELVERNWLSLGDDVVRQLKIQETPS